MGRTVFYRRFSKISAAPFARRQGSLLKKISAVILACALFASGCSLMGGRAPEQYLVFFTFNETTLSASSASIVQRAAADIKTRRAVTRVEIAGYRGNDGDQRANTELQSKRFASVENALVAHGIDRSLLVRNELKDTVVLPDTALRRLEIHIVSAGAR